MKNRIKHTPGPFSVVVRNPDLSINNGEASVAQIYTVDTLDGITVAECGGSDCNAHLFAAAPELLDAVKRVLNALEYRQMEKLPSRHDLKQLIAKAEGKKHD